MKNIKSITVTKGEKSLEIHNPTNYSLIGMGSQGAVFKLSEDKCVKIYTDPLQAKMEADALKAGQHLSFMPKVFETGPNYVVIEYYNAPTLKEYLRNCTYIPESIAMKLLFILKELKKAKFSMIDAPLHHIFVLENEELKVINHVNSFKRNNPVPLKLLRDLKMMLLKESFLSYVEKLEPKTFEEWENYFSQNRLDFRNIMVTSGGSGEGVKVDSAITQTLIGKGHQGAVYRVSEDQCVKLYGKVEHATKEKEVLLSSQKLSFIPKVFETGSNYILMEYLLGPDLNTYLKKQSALAEDITRQLLDILTSMKKSGFKQIDAPLRHIIITRNGFKLVDYVYSFSREQNRPLELFKDLRERNFLDSFLEQVKELDPNTHAEWTKTPIPLSEEEPEQIGETKKNERSKSKKDSKSKKETESKLASKSTKGTERINTNSKFVTITKKGTNSRKASKSKIDTNSKFVTITKKRTDSKKESKSKIDTNSKFVTITKKRTDSKKESNSTKGKKKD